MKRACMAGNHESQHANCAFRTASSDKYGTRSADVMRASALCVAGLRLCVCPVLVNLWVGGTAGR